MNESQHTPGPAILVPGYDGMIALGERPEDADHCVKMFNAMTHRLDPEDIANARRIAACWNVCQGIPTETLEAGRCKMTFEMPLDAPEHAELTFSVPPSNLVHVDVSDLPKPSPPLDRSYPRLAVLPFQVGRAGYLAAVGPVHLEQCPCEEPRGAAGGVCATCWNAILTDEERKQDVTS